MIKYFSQVTENYEGLELELITRQARPKSLEIAYCRVFSKNVYNEFISIPSKEECVVVSFSSISKNREYYRKMMFEIVDTIDL